MKRSITLLILVVIILLIAATPTDSQQTEDTLLLNADWTPVIETFDSVEMVLVPAGCFTMGSTERQIADQIALGALTNWFTYEQPATEVCFDAPFWIDRYEVTNTQFARFDGVARRTSRWPEDDLPRERILWAEARDFCLLRGARLPTEAEWEYAARGPESWQYPWGNEFVAENVVHLDNTDWRTAPVGSRPGGASWVGAYDMSGNVWEWTSSAFRPYPYDPDDGRESDSDPDQTRVMRGGSWQHGGPYISYLRAATRNGGDPNFTNNGRGFRCARDD